jgi:hypothetical protein
VVIVRVMATVVEMGAVVGRFVVRVFMLVHRQRERADQQINRYKQKRRAIGANLSHHRTARKAGKVTTCDRTHSIICTDYASSGQSRGPGCDA